MASMFLGATSFAGFLDNFDTSSVESMHSMFYQASSFNGQLKHWNVANVRDFSFMFYQATSFDKDLSSWHVGQAYNMNSMFEGASSFDKDLCQWANKIDMKVIFHAINMFKGTDCDMTTDPIFVGDGVTGSMCSDCITTGNRQ